MDAVQSLGCIACKRELGVFTPAEIHHILRNGRRIDHYHTLPLCATHHRGGVNDSRATSRHPYRRAFEERYGDEWDLLAEVRSSLRTRFPTTGSRFAMETSC